MRLYLLRHAEAASTHPDEARELTAHGRKSLLRLAELLRGKHVVEVDRIAHSTLARARQSAEIFAREMALEAPLETLPGLEPFAPAPPIGEMAATHPGSGLLLVGHNPHMESLLSYLLTGDAFGELVNVSKAALACLERVGSEGAQGRVRWRMRWHVTPKLLG